MAGTVAVTGCLGPGGSDSPTTATDGTTDDPYTLPYDVRLSNKSTTESFTVRLTVTRLDGTEAVVFDEQYTLAPAESIDVADPVPGAGTYQLEASLDSGAADSVEFKTRDEGLYDYEGYLVTVSSSGVDIFIVEA